MENLERSIEGKDGEIICSCRGTIQDVMACLRTTVDTIKGSVADCGLLIEMPFSGNKVRKSGMEKVDVLLRKQSDCVKSGLARLGEKVE